MRGASIFIRLLAFSIDVMVITCLASLISIAVIAGYALSPGSLSAPPLPSLSLILICGSTFIVVFYFTYLTMNGSATVGKSIFRLKVVRPDGSHLNFIRAFIRCIAYLPSLSFWLITLLVALFFRGRSIHDVIAGSQVIEEES
jgi:uncharacterized RDD family membrane protein YckC